MDDQYVVDYPLITGSSCHPTIILRTWTRNNKWIVFFLHECNKISTYDGVAATPQEALYLFIKHRIKGERFISSNRIGAYAYVDF